MAGNIKYPKTVREDNVCNLCQRTMARLSDDHIPPKGWMAPRSIKIESYPEGAPDDIFRSSVKPNGLVFKTICSDCNNILGARYDKALKDFTASISKVVESPLNVSNSFSFCTQPGLVTKAVLGHMLAAKTGECNTTIDQLIREYVMNVDSKLSPKIKLYYWFYPCETAIISLDKMACDLIDGSHAFYSVLKYYPVAFMMMYESEMNDKGFCELTKYIKKDESVSVRVPFKLKTIPLMFPESIKYSQCCLVPDGHTDLIAR